MCYFFYIFYCEAKAYYSRVFDPAYLSQLLCIGEVINSDGQEDIQEGV